MEKRYNSMEKMIISMENNGAIKQQKLGKMIISKENNGYQTPKDGKI